MSRNNRGNNPSGRNQGRGVPNNPSGRNQHNQKDYCTVCTSFYDVGKGHSQMQCDNNRRAQERRPGSPLRPGDVPSED